MTIKEEILLKEIISFYKKNKEMPTIRYLRDKLGYKSNYSIQTLLKQLEKENYLIRNEQKKLILENQIIDNENLKIIKIINSNSNVSIILNKEKKYTAYLLKNNYFTNNGLYKNDIIIIEKTKKLENGDYGLFLIDKKYRFMQYTFKDGFYILQDNDKIILNKVKIIGKAIMIERKINKKSMPN